MMPPPFVNITGLVPLATSLQVVLLFSQGAQEKDRQVLLEMSSPNRTWYLSHPLPPLQGGHSQQQEPGTLQITVSDLAPGTPYRACPRLIDALGRVWHEGPCQDATTHPETHSCAKAILTACVCLLASLLFLAACGLALRHARARLTRKGFTLRAPQQQQPNANHNQGPQGNVKAHKDGNRC